LAIVGALFGWKAIPAVVFLGSLVGILISIPVLVLRRRGAAAARPAELASTAAESPPPSIRRAEVPFGPFLAASALAYLFLGKLAWAALVRFLTGE
jgi:prepilin signal peptidase PulO-like enzyme (type II secretory pathway)